MTRIITTTDGRKAIELDRPGFDEVGTPDEYIGWCADCGKHYRKKNGHDCAEAER